MAPGADAANRIARILAVPSVVLAAFLAVALMLTPTPRAEALDGEEAAVLEMINSYRVANGLTPLSIDSRLNDVARWMANDMASNNYFSHTDSLGRDPFTRMDQLGYAVNTWRGENLVAGTQTAAASFEMWRTSQGHNANMLGPNYTSIGIARAYNPASTFGWYWATEFGGPDLNAPAPPPPVQPAPAPQPQPVVQVQPPPQSEVAEPVVTAAPPPAPTAQPTLAPMLAPDEPWWHSLRLPRVTWLEPSGRDSSGWLAAFLEAVRSLAPGSADVVWAR